MILLKFVLKIIINFIYFINLRKKKLFKEPLEQDASLSGPEIEGVFGNIQDIQKFHLEVRKFIFF